MEQHELERVMAQHQFYWRLLIALVVVMIFAISAIGLMIVQRLERVALRVESAEQKASESLERINQTLDQTRPLADAAARTSEAVNKMMSKEGMKQVASEGVRHAGDLAREMVTDAVNDLLSGSGKNKTKKPAR